MCRNAAFLLLTLVTALTISATGLPGSVQAQEQAASGILEEIIVTARRREESLMETPVSVTAFTNAELGARQIDQIHQIAESTPGLVFVNSGGTGATLGATMYIRGVGQRDLLPTLQPGVGLYIDGGYVSQVSSGLTNMVDIESVEVLRGPQGTLFGRNTVGGAILINSIKPNEEFGGDVDVTLGEFNRQQVKASVNVPFTDNFFGRFTVMNRDKDGYVDTINIPQDDGLGSDDTTSARVALRWLTDSVTIDWTTDFTHHESDGKPNVMTSMINNLPGTDAFSYNVVTSPVQGGPPFTNANSFFPLDAYRNAAGFYHRSDWDIWGTSLGVEWQLSDNLTFNSITTYRDADGSGGEDNDQGLANVFHTFNFYESEQLTQEFRLSGSAVDDRLQWTSGLYWFEEESSEFNDVDFPFFEARSGSFVDNTSFAAFGQFTYDVSDRVSITLGARYTDEKFDDVVDDSVQFATALFNPGAPPPGNPPLPPGYVFPVICCQLYFGLPPDPSAFKIVPNQIFETDSDDVNPYFSIAYNFTDTLMGYFSYSEAFKGGGFTQRIGPGNEVNAFFPEFAEVYELGAKWSGERVRLTASLFFNDYVDLQVSTDRQIGGTIENAASAEIKGGEFELLAAATDRLQVSVGLGYLDGKYVELNPNVAFPLGLDAALPNVMDWQRNASLVYSAPVATGEIIARVDYSFVDGHFVEADNIPESFIDDYSVVNVGLTYIHGSDRWEIAFQGRNVGDEVYFTDASESPSSDGFTTGHVQPPSEYAMRFKYRF